MGPGRLANGLHPTCFSMIRIPGVEWVPCYESANEGDARTVLALLEGRGFPCRLESLGGVLPTMGFAVLVPADQLEAAQELLESETPEDAEVVAAAEPEVATPEPSVAVGEVRTMDLARRAVRFVREHPTILLTAVSSFVTTAVLDAIADPAAGRLEMLRTHVGPITLVLAFETVVYGLALAFVDSALEGRASWPEAARRVTPPLGRLLAFELVLGAPFFVPIWFGWLPETYPPALTALLVVAAVTYAYVLFRLFFVPMALIVDRTDVSEACRRSWALVGRAWTTILGLCVLSAVVSLPFGLAKPVDRVVQPLVGVVQTVAFVLAYRMLTARATASSDTR
jgi:hypothetical protein